MSENNTGSFQLQEFWPYALNQAAEATSLGFQSVYRKKLAMTRTEWRVLAHLGEFGQMTAKEICHRASLHKTKVSRAVVALENKRWLNRSTHEQDRRAEYLILTSAGEQAYHDLTKDGDALNAELVAGLNADELATFRKVLDTLSRNAKDFV
ncbi:MAG: MarR family winged helix-turn-helix transcriptional regulator [Hyphomicrobiales bacterium]